MMLYKALGSVFLVASALIFALQAQKYEREKLRQTEAFIELIGFIKKQIDCFCLPIDKIMAKTNFDLLKRCGFVPSNRKNMPLASSFKWFLSKCNMCIDNEEKELLERFSEELGKSYRDEQLKSCDYYISELERYKNGIETEIPKKKKLSVAISLCISLSFILLML